MKMTAKEKDGHRRELDYFLRAMEDNRWLAGNKWLDARKMLMGRSAPASTALEGARINVASTRRWLDRNGVKQVSTFKQDFTVLAPAMLEVILANFPEE